MADEGVRPIDQAELREIQQGLDGICEGEPTRGLPLEGGCRAIQEVDDQGGGRGFVVEDRGPIGVDGRRLFRVRFPLRPKAEDEEHFAELPADRFEVLENAA